MKKQIIKHGGQQIGVIENVILRDNIAIMSTSGHMNHKLKLNDLVKINTRYVNQLVIGRIINFSTKEYIRLSLLGTYKRYPRSNDRLNASYTSNLIEGVYIDCDVWLLTKQEFLTLMKVKLKIW